jgi:uncharacterized protein (UPF0305 family)
METNIVPNKENHYIKFYQTIDEKADDIAKKISNNENVTSDILQFINEIYNEVASYKEHFHDDNKFEVAYHEPITSYLEFFIARILYHFSEIKKLGWKIYLRRQVGKKPNRVAPDIRIEKNGKTIAIIEIKAKVGWAQGMFSEERFKKYEEKSEKTINEFRRTLEKYKNLFNIDYSQIFLLIPSLREAHKKIHNESFEDHINWTSKKTGLSKENIIVLSENLELELEEKEVDRNELFPTNRFENMIKKLERLQ